VRRNFCRSYKEVNISRESRRPGRQVTAVPSMVVQTLAPGFTAASIKDKRESNRANTKSAVSKIQWPEFKVSQPDPVLGEIFSGKGALTPEQTLVEFISTSAAFHGVKKQPLRTLEWDLLKVFPYNVMPANAAAWYMAKRKFYMNQSFDQQLLPYLLKKYPEKFKVIGTQVVFLEVYNQEVAKMKLKYLVQYGMNAYFSHKADEYGVYFFDPFYYENTEPFHESLRQCSSNPNMPNKSKLVSNYFNASGLKEQFKFQQHSAYLVSICKQPGVKIVTNTTGVIISMINNQYGFIKFGSGETALFCCKSLFKDGWKFSGDPLKLPAMKFDGYQITGGGVRGDQAYSWYAVLVWCGRRPSPQYCSTAEDLNSTPVFREGRIQRMSVGGSPIMGEGGKKLRQPSSSMMVGEVMEIRRNGAVLKVREDSQDKVFVPGWKRQLANSSGTWLSTMSGECIGLGDLVAYYVDMQDIRPGYTAVGKNVMVLKESPDVNKKGRRRHLSTERSEGAKYGVDSTGDEMEPRRRVADSDSDSGSEGGISDGELEWLEKDIGSIIAKEDPQAKTLKLLSDVQSQLGTVRVKKGGVKKKGVVKSFRSGYTPMGNSSESFWRMKKLLASVDAGYNSEDDPDYEPGDEVEQVRKPREISDTADSSFTSGVVTSEPGRIGQRRRVDTNASSASVGRRSDRVHAESGGRKLPYWVRAVSLPEKFDPELGKFVAVDKGYLEEKDPDYELPVTDEEINVSDEEDEELEQLVKEALEELPAELKEGKYKSSQVISPVKVTLTPSKEGDEDPKEEILTLESDGEGISNEKPPGMWVRELLLKEQAEEYDSEEDPEYVPPSIIYETDKEYDEYSDGGDVIPKEEVTSLLDEQKKHLEPPSTYIPIWVPVPSPAEKIARAKEQVVANGEKNKEESKSETSGKDTDTNGKKVDQVATLKMNPSQVETGLTPVMKKMNLEGNDEVVDRSNVKKMSVESNDVSKPKRERKKSKSKCGEEGEEVAKGDFAKGDVIDKVDIKKSAADAADKIEQASVRKDEGATSKASGKGSAESPVKSKSTEKGKKSPIKKVVGPGGEGHD